MNENNASVLFYTAILSEYFESMMDCKSNDPLIKAFAWAESLEHAKNKYIKPNKK